MFKNGVFYLFFFLLSSIREIVCPRCTYYPNYPISMFPNYSKNCRSKCCSGIKTSSSTVCCTDVSESWVAPVAVVCSLVLICCIVGIIITVCVLKSQKRKRIMFPTNTSPLVATGYPTTTITEPYTYNNYPVNQSYYTPPPPSYDAFERQPATMNLALPATSKY